MTASFEAQLVAAAEWILARSDEGGHDDRSSVRELCAEAFAWMRAVQRADALYAGLIAQARAISQADDRTFQMSVLVRSLVRSHRLTEAKALAAECAGGSVRSGGEPYQRSLDAQKVADVWIAVGDLEKARPFVALAASTAREITSVTSIFAIQGALDLLVGMGDHPGAGALLDHAKTLARGNDAFASSGLGRIEARIGRIDDAWARAHTLVAHHINLAVLLTDLTAADPTRMDAMRDLLAKVEDPAIRGALLVSAARGLAKHPDYFGAAIELIDESLARISTATGKQRWGPLANAAEILNDAGESGRAARMAREALECMDAEDSHHVGVTGKALARAGEKSLALDVLLKWNARPVTGDQLWMGALLARDIAFSFPPPPDS